MPHGQKPYGRTEALDTVFGVQDMGELAARQGSIVTFDRRGNVVWMDDFESSLCKWGTYVVGPGAAVVESNETARNGATSCKVTTSNILGQWSGIRHDNPYPVLGKLGFEMSVSHHREINDVLFQWWLWSPAGQYQAFMEYDVQAQTLSIQVLGGGWVVIDPALNLQALHLMFNTFKMVVDFSTGMWERLIVNDITYPVAQYPIQWLALGGASAQHIVASVSTSVLFNRDAYFDDAILTQNEP